MVQKLDFHTGKKIVAEIEGINPEMLMDVTVYRIKAGQSLAFSETAKETAVLLTEGKVFFNWEGNREEASRSNVFCQPPYCLHVCRGTECHVEAEADSEVLVQMTTNSAEFPARFYRATDCKTELMGADQWEGTAKREVLTIFDYQNAPYSNMVMGEVITKAGRWSSYIPHSHPQPEVYYYKFDHPQGFGGCFIGEDAFKITDGSAASIPGGLTHPQTTAPGYNMYYCWMIRHLEGNPWKVRENDPQHLWLLEE